MTRNKDLDKDGETLGRVSSTQQTADGEREMTTAETSSPVELEKESELLT